MTFEECVQPRGEVEAIISYLDGRQEVLRFKNTILRKGREALAKSLANEIGDSYDFFISRMLFGDDGTTGGTPKFVNTERNGLFGVTRANKPVISSISATPPSTVIFTSVIAYSEANGFVLNEMALQMNNGDLYSMVTFPDLSKTAQIQVVWNWSMNFV